MNKSVTYDIMKKCLASKDFFIASIGTVIFFALLNLTNIFAVLRYFKKSDDLFLTVIFTLFLVAFVIAEGLICCGLISCHRFSNGKISNKNGIKIFLRGMLATVILCITEYALLLIDKKFSLPIAIIFLILILIYGFAYYDLKKFIRKVSSGEIRKISNYIIFFFSAAGILSATVNLGIWSVVVFSFLASPILLFVDYFNSFDYYHTFFENLRYLLPLTLFLISIIFTSVMFLTVIFKFNKDINSQEESKSNLQS